MDTRGTKKPNCANILQQLPPQNAFLARFLGGGGGAARFFAVKKPLFFELIVEPGLLLTLLALFLLVVVTLEFIVSTSDRAGVWVLWLGENPPLAGANSL